MSRAKRDGGRMATTENVMEFIERHDDPVVTAPDVADEFDISQQAAYDKLRRLYEAGNIEKKKVGARAAVWYLDADYSLAAPDT